MPKKLLREFADADTQAQSQGSDTSTRTSRSDEGILALTNSVLQDILGLNDETRSRMLKIIRNQGQWFDLKNTIRKLPSVAHRRLNDVINMSRSATTDADAGRDGEDHGEEGFNPEHEPGQYDHEGHGHDREGKYEFEEYREGKKMSFAGYLINELQYTDADLRDPMKKQEIMRLMRSGDAQAEQLVNRAERDQKRDQRQEVTQEKDPQKAGLRRRRLALQRQILKIDQQLEDPGTGQEQQQKQTGFDTF